MNSTEKEVIKIIKNQYPSVSRKVSYFLFLCISVSLWLMLFFPQIVSAEDILSSLKTSSNSKEMEEISISFSEYQYQNALYLYLTGDYFSSSILSSNIINSSLSKMKDKAILLLKQSDINRLSKMREDPIFSFQSFPKEVSERVRLVDVIYEMNEYERLFLSKELDNLGTANFFDGISLLRLNRLADSKRLLLKIPKNDKLYPYAKISIAQIEIMKQNYKEAKEVKLIWHYVAYGEDVVSKRTSKELEALKNNILGLIKEIRFETIDEGKCIQIIHVGPYATEPETIQKMKDFMKRDGYTENGIHHEIYISDPRKTAPEKMKTILRQPIK